MGAEASLLRSVLQYLFRILEGRLSVRHPRTVKTVQVLEVTRCGTYPPQSRKVEQRRDNPACHQSLFLKCKFSTRETNAAEKGTRVRLFHPPVEGKLIRGFKGLDVGDRVRVELIGTDVEQGFIDFARAGKRQGD
jgi:exoribonuclease-2